MWRFAQKHHRFLLLLSLYLARTALLRTFKDNTLAYYFIIAFLLRIIIPHLEI